MPADWSNADCSNTLLKCILLEHIAQKGGHSRLIEWGRCRFLKLAVVFFRFVCVSHFKVMDMSLKINTRISFFIICVRIILSKE